MTVYELAQRIPNDNPDKELILLGKLWEEAQLIRVEAEKIIDQCEGE